MRLHTQRCTDSRLAASLTWSKGVSLYYKSTVQVLVDYTDIRRTKSQRSGLSRKRATSVLVVQQNSTMSIWTKWQKEESRRSTWCMWTSTLSSLIWRTSSPPWSMYTPMEHYPYLGSSQPVTLQLSGPVGEHRITYRETVHVRLPPPYSKCDPEAETRQSEKCMNTCIDKKNRETFPKTTPDNLVYTSWPQNDTRMFDPKYQGAIMTKWGLECRKECPKLDCTQIKISTGKSVLRTSKNL